MGNKLAIYYFLKCEFVRDPDAWFSVKDVSAVVDLSIQRTRRHLSELSICGDIETKIDGWSNIYRFKGFSN